MYGYLNVVSANLTGYPRFGQVPRSKMEKELKQQEKNSLTTSAVSRRGRAQSSKSLFITVVHSRNTRRNSSPRRKVSCEILSVLWASIHVVHAHYTSLVSKCAETNVNYCELQLGARCLPAEEYTMTRSVCYTIRK